MNIKIFFFISIVFAIGVTLFIVLVPGSRETYVVTTPLKTDTIIATSSSTTIVEATSTVEKSIPIPIVIPKKTPKPIPVVVPPVVVNPPIISTSTENNTIGTTKLAIRSIPLLFGGTVHSGDSSVPISYLQITNIGKEGTVLKGFWVKQTGTAPTESIIGLSTIDDEGGSRGLTGGSAGSSPFQNGVAFAPTNAFFAPHQMRLFTIKAIMTNSLSSYLGTQLIIEVSSIETSSSTEVKGKFPIKGTTWTIAE